MKKDIEKLNIEIHQKIFDRIKDKGITIYALSKSSGVSRQTIMLWQANPQHNITRDNLLKICLSLDIKADFTNT